MITEADLVGVERYVMEAQARISINGVRELIEEVRRLQEEVRVLKSELDAERKRQRGAT